MRGRQVDRAHLAAELVVLLSGPAADWLLLEAPRFERGLSPKRPGFDIASAPATWRGQFAGSDLADTFDARAAAEEIAGLDGATVDEADRVMLRAHAARLLAELQRHWPDTMTFVPAHSLKGAAVADEFLGRVGFMGDAVRQLLAAAKVGSETLPSFIAVPFVRSFARAARPAAPLECEPQEGGRLASLAVRQRPSLPLF